MKLSRSFIVFILILFVLLVLVEVKIPKRFAWEEWTYSHNDPNPFGSMLVDSLLKSSLNCGYEVKPGYLIDAFNDSDSLNTTILLVDYDIDDYDKEEIDMFIKMLRRGQNIIYINDNLSDSLGNILGAQLDNEYDYHAPSYYFTNSDSTTLIWKPDSIYDRTQYNFRIFSTYNSAIIADFDWEHAKWTPFIKQKQKQGGDIIIGGSRKLGKGKLVIMSWAQVFTNYNVLEKNGANLLMRIMSQAGNSRVIRYDYTVSEDYLIEQNRSQSPLRVFLDNKSLRWAVYLALFTILLSLIFTARRRQRVIPIIEPPKNQTLTMVKHIGLMHYRHHDNASMLRDQYDHFTHEMMRRVLVDINDDIDLDENMKLLINRTDIDSKELKDAVSRLKEIKNDYELKISDKETKHLIDLMNKITNDI